MSQYTKAIIIGLWRHGNPDAIIVAITDCSLKEVFETIKTYNP